MELLIERCAGLDVHKASVTATVWIPDQVGGRLQQTRSFRATTAGLVLLGDWLASFGVTVVGMESTGVYWRPVYYLLEDDFQCWLLNAAHLRNVPGRKTDVADSVWICQLVEHGLVRPSFVPPKPIRELRDLTRYRKALIQERTREAQRLQKVLEDAGIKLGTVASDVLGVSGRAMLDALVAGTHDPVVLAELARVACGPSYRRCERRWRAASAPITRCCWASCWPTWTTSTRPSTGSATRSPGWSPPLAAAGPVDHDPGVSQRTAEVILAEIGTDMGQFPSAGHLASWAGICPGNNESAGKHRAGTTRKGSRWLRVALIEAANAAARGKGTYLASQYARLKGRRGHKKAIVAVAHSILVIAWHLLSTGQPYSDLGADWFLQRHSSEAYRNRLVRQLERMGHKVTLEPADAA
jgi:transposase